MVHERTRIHRVKIIFTLVKYLSGKHQNKTEIEKKKMVFKSSKVALYFLHQKIFLEGVGEEGGELSIW